MSLYDVIQEIQINILTLSILINDCERVLIYIKTGNNRKVIWLSVVELSCSDRKALLGNDYFPLFSRKTKSTCWKILCNNSRYFDTFANLGASWFSSHVLLSQLGEFLFGYHHLKDANALCYHINQQKYECNNKISDLSLLPPC